MTSKVLTIKKHSCPTCGGQLIVNEDRQMYECPFCGVSFDYEYFREDDVLELANKSLANGEFSSAKDAYGFMLKKDPHNFLALRGRVLVDIGVMGTSELGNPDTLLKMTPSGFAAADKSISQAIDSVETDHKAYFAKMKELLDFGKKYQKEDTEAQDIHRDRKRSASKTTALETEVEGNYLKIRGQNAFGEESTQSVHPIHALICATVILAAWALLMFFIFHNVDYSSIPNLSEKTIQAHRSRDLKEMILFIALPAVGVVIFDALCLYRWTKVKESERKAMESNAETVQLDGKLDLAQKDMVETARSIRRVYKEMKELDPYPDVQVASAKQVLREKHIRRKRWQ